MKLLGDIITIISPLNGELYMRFTNGSNETRMEVSAQSKHMVRVLGSARSNMLQRYPLCSICPHVDEAVALLFMAYVYAVVPGTCIAVLYPTFKKLWARPGFVTPLAYELQISYTFHCFRCLLGQRVYNPSMPFCSAPASDHLGYPLGHIMTHFMNFVHCRW
jgi:hypothetical protein